uniref:PqqD family protein n=1 Tax=uncultured prokaryote TaxID=198431 RepID=A0A0H5QCF5_9ZZZZ|nr:hypothetical protein [uncultured prokaryote]
MTQKHIVPRHDLKLIAVGNKFVMVLSTGSSAELARICTMNETAVYLWEALCDGRCTTAEELAGLLCQTYEVTAGRARSDVRLLLADWERLGLIEY